MREHGFDAEEVALRPKAGRVEEQVSDHVGKAAAEGRTDVVGGAGMLGLQRAVGNSGVTSMIEEERSPVHDVVSGGGRPLEPEVRGEMEGRLGHDFSDVRVHDDGAAHESAKAVNAHAYTVGSNLVFQRDKYDPGSDAGKVMLAHELTHVVQQRSGPVDGSSAPGGIKVSDPSDRFEREAASTAERAMAAPAPSPVPVAAAAPVQRDVDEAGAPPVQRDEAPAEEEKEEEAVQGAFVQRDEEETQEEES
ncbi:uncharacterized protein DUF4157 [Kribbella orskensis]|uniref:Uncharacterized protein DUF4157 n=1 Tax=Kribbella orskensis TaxID=2512216 RepID=A0ABY2BBY4_9ACTN|nr:MULTISPECIES: DUF4157 domain-containing protein [Kribbella]TCN34596.1 uncharacterized protein DUF4157 [Kribbella sp. VKM Ac-2500]TCO14973.1 uncharacterized protein DUF4157 [Kribbella orskensis]